MTTLDLSIDDDDKGLGADDDLPLEKVADEGVRMEEVDCRLHAEFNEFRVFLGTARDLLVAVREGGSQRGWRCNDFFGLLCQTQGPGEVEPTPGVSPKCWAPCQLVLQVADLCCL